MIVTRTPLRVSLFGGGTDFPAWYREHGGEVLSGTIDKYCWITMRRLPPFFPHRVRLTWSKIETVDDATYLEHPSARACMSYLGLEQGIEAHHDGDLPARSGMGTSSAFTVGFLHALHALDGLHVDRATLARKAIHVEQELLKETVGSQDQVSAAYGGLNSIHFSGSDIIRVEPLHLKPERLRELEEHLMLFYTGLARTSSDVQATWAVSPTLKASVLSQLQGQAAVARKLLQKNEPISTIGTLLLEAWYLKRHLSAAVTTPEIDALYKDAIGAGARGGKILGAGGGGFLLVFAAPEARESVRRRLGKLVEVPLRFTHRGSEVVHYDPA